MSFEKSMTISIAIVGALLAMYGVWIYDLKNDVKELQTNLAEVETSHNKLSQTLVDYYPQDYEFITSRLQQNEDDIEAVRKGLVGTLEILQQHGY